MNRPTPSVALSVIIPVHREEAHINDLLAHLAAIPAPGDLEMRESGTGRVEIIVVDGDPKRRTLAAISQDALDQTLIKLPSDRGRARQMNAGAASAQGEVLLFLHADTRLPLDAFARIEHALFPEPGKAESCGGAFALRILPEDGGQPGPGLRFIAWAANLRARLTRAPFGDQAIFMRRDCFVPLGGFPDIPLMEDLEFMTRLRRRGLPITILSAKVVTSARRWEREGLLRCTGRNILLRALYHLGVSPQRLARLYP